MRASLLKSVYAVGLSAAIVGLTSGPAAAQGIVTNGAGLAVGIQETGAMGVSGLRPAEAGAPASFGLTGLSFVSDYDLAGPAGPTWRDATTPGCLCEGFGVSVNGAVSGFDSNDNGTGGLTVLDLGGTIIGTDRITTLVELSAMPGLTIMHDYHPSASANLYQADVTITNSTGAAVTDVQYTRTMDWDVPPTEFAELVTLVGWVAPGVPLGDLVDSCNNGFTTGNPLVDCANFFGDFEDENFVDAGPFDHGARFTFNFGGLGVGETKTFSIFYGAAAGEAAALAALSTAGAEGIYSFGQCNPGPPGGVCGGPPSDGLPATFIFAFGGVGAPPVAVPEPVSLLLFGSGIAGVLVKRYRRK
jgi:type IV pilus assembly protein PilY1